MGDPNPSSANEHDIYKTTNGGTTWVDNGANQAAFSFVYFKDNSTGFLAIDNYYDYEHNGKITMTTNGGVNWFDPDDPGIQLWLPQDYF